MSAENERRETCGNCKFFQQDSASVGGFTALSGGGACHRFPPQGAHRDSGWPRVSPDRDWCGEWRTKHDAFSRFG